MAPNPLDKPLHSPLPHSHKPLHSPLLHSRIKTAVVIHITTKETFHLQYAYRPQHIFFQNRKRGKKCTHTYFNYAPTR